MTTPCPCNSKKSFSDCCAPYLHGEKIAETPEKLMRSRYTAYSQTDINYIMKTMCGKAAENYDVDNARAWASSVKWLGLTIIDAPIASGNSGTVTFFARFCDAGINQYIYEKSNFEKINGVWFYVDGVAPKINRNEDCLCGSGRKFKRCCDMN